MKCLLTTLRKRCAGGLKLLRYPIACTEERVGVRAESSDLVRGGFVAENTDQNYPYTTTARVFMGGQDNPVVPEPDQLINENTHISLRLIRVSLLWARDDHA